MPFINTLSLCFLTSFLVGIGLADAGLTTLASFCLAGGLNIFMLYIGVFLNQILTRR